jgi:hypothetical protein
MRLSAVPIACCLAAAGCSSTSSQQQLEASALLDASGPDAAFDLAQADLRSDRGVDAPCPPGGFVCTSSAECCGQQTCERLPSGVRVCAKHCYPDDPMPWIGGCSQGLRCAAIGPTHSDGRCLRPCKLVVGKQTCPKGLSCDPRSLRWNEGPVCGFTACGGPTDCPVRLSASCDPASSTPQCSGEPAGAFCAPDDLGQSGTGTCALPGVCDLPSGRCLPHKLGKSSALIGAPCVDDRDCAGEMRCDRQRVAADGTVYARNGYCIKEGCELAADAPTLACPVGSTCVRVNPGGHCKKTCQLTQAADCRGYSSDKHGDYECYDWTQLAIGNKPVSKAPACEPSLPCAMWSSPGYLDCSIMGAKNNPTKMACRNRATGAELPKHDPGGYCLDLTASGK